MKKTLNNSFVRRMTVGLLVLLVGAVAAFGQTEGNGPVSEANGYDPFLVAAEALGISEGELDDLIEEGKTIAQIARGLSLDPETIVEAIRQADSAETDLALAEGEIGEAEAAEWRDFGYAFAVEVVYLPMDSMFWGDLDELGILTELTELEEFAEFTEFGEFTEYDEFNPFESELLGFMPYGLMIETQRTMAYSLLDSGVKPQAVVDSILEAEESLLDEIIGFITGLFVFDMMDWEYGSGEDLWEDEIIAIVSQTLGISAETTWLAMDEGQTLASLAQTHNTEPQILIDLLMSEEEEWIAELLSDGELSEVEAADWRADSLEMVQEIVNEPWF
jgi:hypothetical protein